MTDQFLHGVEVIEVDDGARPIQTSSASIIGLVGTAPRGPVNTPTLITGSRRQAVTTFGEPSAGFTIPEVLDAIFDQTGAMVVVINVANPDDDNHQSSMSGESGTFDENDRLQLAYSSVRQVVVKDSSGNTTYTENVDYRIDLECGLITRIDSGSMSVGQDVSVDYDYLDSTKVTHGDVIGGIDEATGVSSGLQMSALAHNRY